VSAHQFAICWLCLPVRPSLLAVSALQIRHVLTSRLLFNWLVVNGYFVAHFGGHSVRCSFVRQVRHVLAVSCLIIDLVLGDLFFSLSCPFRSPP
jgi:hypothetical protein